MENFQTESQQNNFNQLPQQNSKKQIPSWIGFAIIVIAVVVLFGGVLGYQYLVKISNSETLTSNENSNAETAGPALSEVEGWKTYTNDEYGFELKYPKDYHVEKNLFSTNFSLILCPPDFTEKESDNSTGCKVKSATKGDYEGGIYIFTYSDNNILNKEKYRYLGYNSLDNKYYYLFLHDSLLQYKNIVEKIILTFRFIQEDQTSGWKTYTNSEYGFEIKYPVEVGFSENNENAVFWSGDQQITVKSPVVIDSDNSANTGATVSVLIGTEKKNIDNCLKFNFYQPLENSTNEQQINGITFYTKSQDDSAMGGQRGIITQYSVIRNNICYTLYTQIHWRDVAFVHEVTDGKQPTQEEINDQNKSIKNQKDFVSSILSTFKFTNSVAVTKEQACMASGGRVISENCNCPDSAVPPDFYNHCIMALNTCFCDPSLGIKRQLKSCDCGSVKCWNGTECSTIEKEKNKLK